MSKQQWPFMDSGGNCLKKLVTCSLYSDESVFEPPCIVWLLYYCVVKPKKSQPHTLRRFTAHVAGATDNVIVKV